MTNEDIKEKVHDLFKNEHYEEVIGLLAPRASELDDVLKMILYNSYVKHSWNLRNSEDDLSEDLIIKNMDKGIDYLQSAIKLIPEQPQAYIDRGHTLSAKVYHVDDTHEKQLHLDAMSMFEKALQYDSDSVEALFYLGNELSALGYCVEYPESDTYYMKAYDYYHRSLLLGEQPNIVYESMGNCLVSMATERIGKEAEDLYQSSFELFELAAKARPDLQMPYNSWGMALTELAGITSEDKCDSIYKEAYDKYQTSLDICPQDIDINHSWGETLVLQGLRKSGTEQIRLFDEAIEKYRQSDIWVDYHIGLVELLKGNVDEFKSCLRKAKEDGELPGQDTFDKEALLDSFRDQDWFKEFIASLQS